MPSMHGARVGAAALPVEVPELKKRVSMRRASNAAEFALTRAEMRLAESRVSTSLMPARMRKLTWEVRIGIQTAALTLILNLTAIGVATPKLSLLDGITATSTPGARVTLCGSCVSAAGALFVVTTAAWMRQDTGIPQFTVMFICCILGCLCHTAGAMVNGIADNYSTAGHELDAGLIVLCTLVALMELVGAATCYHAARAADLVSEGLYTSKGERSTRVGVAPGA